jgi:hypothetical protein
MIFEKIVQREAGILRNFEEEHPRKHSRYHILRNFRNQAIKSLEVRRRLRRGIIREDLTVKIKTSAAGRDLCSH